MQEVMVYDDRFIVIASFAWGKRQSLKNREQNTLFILFLKGNLFLLYKADELVGLVKVRHRIFPATSNLSQNEDVTPAMPHLTG